MDLKDEEERDMILRLALILAAVLILGAMYVSYSIGFVHGGLVQEEAFMNEIRIRDFNLTEKLCYIPDEGMFREPEKYAGKVALCKKLASDDSSIVTDYRDEVL